MWKAKVGTSAARGAGYFCCHQWRPRIGGGCGWFCWESTAKKLWEKRNQQPKPAALKVQLIDFVRLRDCPTLRSIAKRH